MPKTQNKRTSRTQITIGKGIISQEKTLPKRASLTLAQKHEICLKKVTEPSLKNKELAKLFDVSEGCISSTLKNSQKWLEIDPQAPEAKGKRQVRENEITGETLTEEQIVAILKENNSISDDESDREITSVSSSEVLAAFDKIFIYLEQNKSQDIIDKGAFKAMKKARREVYRNNFFSKKQMSLDLFVKTNDSVDGVDNNNMNRIGDKDNIMDVDNINFETLYFNEGDFYNHEECEGFIEYQIDQDSLYK
ncbi:7612_t:CDS:2 [Rhizophagus irregularis]|nr:7612_t:CDS:2 [Rhizophagus irregularis]